MSRLNKERKKIIESAIEVINESFTTDLCGKHNSVTLSCASCQAAIVVTWLEEFCDFYID